jgi:hypothetical protein
MGERSIGEVSQARDFVERNRDLFRTVAAGPINVVANEQREFYFDPKKREASLGYREEMGLKNNVFAGAHELGHVADLYKDPDNFLGQFRHAVVRAKELAPEFVDILKKSGKYQPFWEEVIPGEKNEDHLTYMENFLRGKIYQLTNCVDDVSVNRKVGSTFAWLDDKKVIEDLYTRFLFGKDKEGNDDFDYSEKVSLSDQLCYATLLSQMVPGKYNFSKEVAELMTGFRTKANKILGINLAQEVANMTSPAVGIKKESVVNRYHWVNEALEPILIDFLKKDLENSPPTKEQVSKMGSSGSGDSQGNESESENNSDEGGGDGKKISWEPSKVSNPINEKAAKEYKEIKKNEDKKKGEEKLSPEEKQEKVRQEMDERACGNQNVNKEFARDYRKLEKAIPTNTKEKLADVFESFMKTIQEQLKVFYLKNCSSGKFDLDTFISKYADQVNNPDLLGTIPWNNLNVFNQQEFISRLALQPSEIYFHLVVDGSGSMQGDRIESVRSLSVLFLEALGTFESRVNTRFRLKQPFQVNTELRIFGSEDEILKPFQQGMDPERELTSRFAAVGGITSDRGGTNDSEPLRNINNALNQERIDKIAAKKAMEMVVLITDGGSSDSNATKDELEKLKSKGLVLRGLQIGSPDDGEVESFKNVWGESDGAKVKTLEELPDVFAKLISGFIGSIAPEIQFYEVDDDQ